MAKTFLVSFNTCYISGPHRNSNTIERLPRSAGLGDNTKLHNDPYACFAIGGLAVASFVVGFFRLKR